ncbi:unnamed protein product [Ectocarpus sp. 12 AP-2014]
MKGCASSSRRRHRRPRPPVFSLALPTRLVRMATAMMTVAMATVKIGLVEAKDDGGGAVPSVVIGAVPPSTETQQQSHNDVGSTTTHDRLRGSMTVPRPSLMESDEPSSWTGAGGKFGLTSDWREAAMMPGARGGEATMRGDNCMGNAKQRQVREILERRANTPGTSKVAACVRTKDFGRFLPEWIAYHYAIGVDEMTIYDDESNDDTVEILQPFVDAGIVTYVLERTGHWQNQMTPLNLCLEEHMVRRLGDNDAPRWLLFHDTDEYIVPVDKSVTIAQALDKHSSTCCVRVPRVTYGAGGHDEMPQGLLLEIFLEHAHLHDFKRNRLPKVMVNLDTTQPLLGQATSRLKSMHNGQGCQCDVIPVDEIRINHYLGSRGDYLGKTKRYWQEVYSRDKVEKWLMERDINSFKSDTITTWACATREVLSVVLEGGDLNKVLPVMDE